MILGVVMTTIMQIFHKLISKETDVPVTVTVISRTLIMFLGSLIIGAIFVGINPFKLSKRKCYLLSHRGLWGSISFSLEVTAIFLMPVGTAMVLISTQPIFCNILAAGLLNEKVKQLDVLALISSTFGVIMIVKTQWVLKVFDHLDDYQHYENHHKKEFPFFELGICLAVISAISSAYSYVWLRRIGKSVHSSVKPMMFGLINFILMSIF
jgi:drug/metabolite transporter (DMT)-like permease